MTRNNAAQIRDTLEVRLAKIKEIKNLSDTTVLLSRIFVGIVVTSLVSVSLIGLYFASRATYFYQKNTFYRNPNDKIFMWVLLIGSIVIGAILAIASIIGLIGLLYPCAALEIRTAKSPKKEGIEQEMDSIQEKIDILNNEHAVESLFLPEGFLEAVARKLNESIRGWDPDAKKELLWQFNQYFRANLIGFIKDPSQKSFTDCLIERTNNDFYRGLRISPALDQVWLSVWRDEHILSDSPRAVEKQGMQTLLNKGIYCEDYKFELDENGEDISINKKITCETKRCRSNKEKCLAVSANCFIVAAVVAFSALIVLAIIAICAAMSKGGSSSDCNCGPTCCFIFTGSGDSCCFSGGPIHVGGDNSENDSHDGITDLRFSPILWLAELATPKSMRIAEKN